MEEYQFAYVPKRQSIVCGTHMRQIGITTNKIHMHNAEELLLITSCGHVRLVSNGHTVTVSTPALIVNRAGAFHETVEVLEVPMQCYVCSFHSGIFTGLSRQWCGADAVLEDSGLVVLPLSKQQCQELAVLFQLLQQQPESQKRFLLLCIFDQLEHWLNDGLIPIRIRSQQTYIFEVAGLLQNMEKGRELTLDRLAERFHVSQTKLKTDFKKITGMSVHAFRRHAQLEEARIMLANPQMELSQIAYCCGFNDESYFIRTFRQAFGMTPGAYRKLPEESSK